MLKSSRKGMYNNGNKCYAIAALQLLLTCPDFIIFCDKIDFLQNQEIFNFLFEFFQLVNHLKVFETKVVDPSEYFTGLANYNSSLQMLHTSQQQDSCEFLDNLFQLFVQMIENNL